MLCIKASRKLYIIATIGLTTVLCLTPLSRGKILYYADYEEGDILDGNTYGIRVEKCCDHSVNVVDAVARKGKKAVRFESRRDDPLVANSPGRAELKVQKTKPIVEEWYRKKGFSKTIGKVQKGVWTDWVFHINWDYREKENGGKGFVEAWQQVDSNGYMKVLDYQGPIGYNDKRGVYLKWGIYKYPWKHHKGNQSPRIHYYDEVKIGDAKATFNDIRASD